MAAIVGRGCYLKGLGQRIAARQRWHLESVEDAGQERVVADRGRELGYTSVAENFMDRSEGGFADLVVAHYLPGVTDQGLLLRGQGVHREAVLNHVDGSLADANLSGRDDMCSPFVGALAFSGGGHDCELADRRRQRRLEADECTEMRRPARNLRAVHQD